jgi:hypothetical protein
MANKELVCLSDVRRAILRFEPEAAYILNGVRKVDAVEVIRCKDCKWWKTPACYFHSPGRCIPRLENDFCSDGERRTDV